MSAEGIPWEVMLGVAGMVSSSAVGSIAAVASVEVEVVFSSGVGSSVAVDSGNVDVVFSSGVVSSVVVAPGLLAEHP